MKTILKRTLVSAATASMFLSGPLHAQATDISNEPLAQPAASVKPNIMLILDDSGSMENQYTPDYLGRRFGGSNALCFDAGDDSSGTITGGLDNCEAGDPPIMSPDVNTQYYNPEIRYFPAVNYDGTSKTIMNSANTAGWTAVPSDAVSPAGFDIYRRTTRDMNGAEGSSITTTVDLTATYPDRVWCDDPSRAATDTTNCKVNSSYTYPDAAFPYGRDTGGNLKYRTGAPYYYRLLPTEYCTDVTLTNCTASAVPVGSYTVGAPVRYCSDNPSSPSAATLSNCQSKYRSGYTYPKFVGNVTGAGSPGSIATGTITLASPQKDTAGGTITGIFVNGVNVIGASITLGASFTPSVAATIIATAIQAHASSPEYTATASSNTVTITYAGSPARDPAPNGYPVTVNFNVTSTTQPTSTIEVTNVSVGNYISSLSVGSTQLINTTVICPSPAIAACPSGGGGSQTTRNSYVASQLATAINNGGSGFTATASGNDVTITAPAGSGSTFNGVTPDHNDVGINVSKTAFTGGITTGDVDLTTVAFSGGSAVVAGSARQNIGNFARISIVPFQDAANTIPSTFTKYPGRGDCLGTSCSYEEEMTNFANWYSYYRTRMQMAKTAIGRSFAGITDAFRVGFITINPSGDMTNRFLAANDFTSSQKDSWYQWLYKQESHGGTPLREALSRVGRYYAGVTTGINSGMSASPTTLACQPNYAILTSDGYWNGAAGVKLDGTSIGNQDNTDSGYSKRSDARYDGSLSSSTNTLADVAMYYYKNDLRTDLTDQVPTTTKDSAPHQHMTTFTVGMGLAGQLNFAQNYEAGGSADFERLKTAPASGGLDWPVPAADSETALDDLWHTAVNGRGTFFSAKNPSELANGIVETLNSVSARVGAGAAAATSNLQPVAGDNFAFTAQYQTVDWIGDLKSKTIDLSTGSVAFRELWSAADLLDQRTHQNRRIYTFDSTDVASPLGAGQNGNQLKSLCSPGTIGVYAECTDGTGLTATEMSYFEPVAGGAAGWTRLAQAAAWLTDGTGRDTSATKEKLLDYLRGDRANEVANVVSPTTTDLFRSRLSLLGDIINAQPAYVKGSPFGYNGGNFAGRDPYYVEFRNSTNGITSQRKGTVFVAANDGMLHAIETDPDNNPYYQIAGISTTLTSDDQFSGTPNTSPVSGDGAERWAYVPSFLLPNLMRLADTPYSHRYYTDGSPLVGDVCFGHTSAVPCAAQANWHTILVAGVNAGGRGYYALDVTIPDSPKGLWEFTGGSSAACITADSDVDGTQTGDCNLGLTFGNPIIAKLPSSFVPTTHAGKWVVMFTSGYNNVSPGDGKGYLYIVDAQTGKLLKRMSTNVGCDGTSSTSPCTAGTVDASGLGRLNAWVDSAFYDNTALTAYAGDLKGNVWRFQLENTTDVPSGNVSRFATLVDGSGVGQPITTKPELGLVSGKRVVFVSTGKFLGISDKSDTQRHSVYAIKDDMNAIGSPVVAIARAGSFPTSTITGFVRQDLTAIDANSRTTTANTVDFTDPTVKGWFIDLPDGGGTSASERVNVDPILQFGSLVVPTNVPSSDTCTAGGYGWLNFLDYRTGGYVPGATANMASTKISASLVVGINVVQLPGGTVKTIVTTADNQQLTQETPVAPSSLQGRRVSWRELFYE